jgi:hypothetical protein
MKRPSFQFYPGDWLKDPELSMCSPATRGIWIDLLCGMHELNHGGLLCGTTEELARLCRSTAVELAQAITELETYHVADVTVCHKKVTVINRRMRREYFERVNAAERQRKHRALSGAVTKMSPPYSSSSNGNSKPLQYPRTGVTTEQPRLTGNEMKPAEKSKAMGFINREILNSTPKPDSKHGNGVDHQKKVELLKRLVAFSESPHSLAYYSASIDELGLGLVEQALGEVKTKYLTGETKTSKARHLTYLLEKWRTESHPSGLGMHD